MGKDVPEDAPPGVPVCLLDDGVPFVVGAAIPNDLAHALEEVFGRPPRFLRPGQGAPRGPGAVVFALDDLPGRRFLAERGQGRGGVPVVVVSDYAGPRTGGVVWLRPREANPAALAVAVRAARVVARLERDRARLLEETSWQRQALDDLRRIDPSTELLSREAWLDEVQRALDLAPVGRDPHPVGVVRLRLRGIVGLRERLGERAVEAVAVQLARRIEGTIRDQDLAGRTADDEFAVLVRGGDVAPAVARVVRALTGFPREPVVVEGAGEIAVAGSFGWALYGEVGTPEMAEDLVRAAAPRWPLRPLAA